MIKRKYKIIGNLPASYAYELIKVDGELRVIGVAPDRPVIGFIIREDKLEEIEVKFID